jgi:hypothetical protein
VKGNKHSDYFEQVRNSLMTERGIPEAKAHAMTWGILRRWAHGGGKVHPEVQAAAAKALAEEGAASAKAHAHATSWDDLADRVFEFATVVELFNPAQPRVAAGSATGGQFSPAAGAQQSASQQQQGKAPAQPLTAAQKHAAHVAHVAHLNHVSTAKAKLMVTAQDDRRQAAGLIKQKAVLQKALASASGKVSSGQAGAKTATTAKTKTTAPATTASATASTAPAKTSATAAKKTASTAAASTPKAGSATAIRAQITSLNTQINSLLASAKQAEAQAAGMK